MMNSYLSKFVSTSKIEVGTTSQSEDPASLFRVLIADDDYNFGLRLVSRHVVKALDELQVCPYEISMASTAQDAYELARMIPFDLILIDKNMDSTAGPHDTFSDGYDAAAAISDLSLKEDRRLSDSSGSAAQFQKVDPEPQNKRVESGQWDQTLLLPNRPFIASISGDHLSEFPKGIRAYVGKPVHYAELCHAIECLVSEKKALNELRAE